MSGHKTETTSFLGSASDSQRVLQMWLYLALPVCFSIAQRLLSAVERAKPCS